MRIFLAAVLLLTCSATGQTTTRPARPSVSQRLETVIPETTFDGRTLNDIVTAVQSATGVNIVVAWHEIDRNQIDTTVRLSGRLSDVSARMVLERALVQLAPDVGDERPRLEVSDDENLARIVARPRTDVRVYNLARLVMKLVEEQKTFNKGATAQDVMDDIFRALQTNVDPEGWREAGGVIGSMRQVGARLVIQQTPANHAAIAELLAKLEKADGK